MDINIKYRELTTGNVVGYHSGMMVFIFKRPHGGWCVSIRSQKEKRIIYKEGYHGTCLSKINIAKEFADRYICSFKPAVK